MTAKRKDIDPHHLAELYRSGMTTEEIAQEIRAGRTTVYRRLNEVMRLPPLGRRTIALDEKRVVKLFRSGIGASGVALAIGSTRERVQTVLRRHGLHRNRAEQQRARMARASPEQRAAWAKPSHDALRGVPHTEEQRCKMALGRQRKGLNYAKVSDTERRLYRALKKAGIETIPQQAIGRYNCDLGAHPVAVEIFGGNWHWHGEHAARADRRFRYILNSGWCLLILHITKRSPLTAVITDYVVSYIQQARSNPPTLREYRVIGRAAETLAVGHADDNEFSVVVPSGYRLKRGIE